jgi:hypothetical protein
MRGAHSKMLEKAHGFPDKVGFELEFVKIKNSKARIFPGFAKEPAITVC